MDKDKDFQNWVLCPICNNKTRIKIFENTEIINFPLFCPKCKKETIVSIKNGKLSILMGDYYRKAE